MKLSTAWLVLPLGLGGLAATSISGASAANLVLNGNFNSPGAPAALVSGDSSYITDWYNTDSYTLYIPYGTRGDATIDGLYGLAGPGYGVVNGLVGPPDDSGYLAIDGDIDFRNSGVYQTISGLVTGKTYTLSFWYAGAQEYSFSDATTQYFQVTLGDETWDSPVQDVAAQGFSPWTEFTTKFTYDGSGDVLTFLAIGAPSGEPPWPLLADVSLSSGVPEPSTWAMIVAGFAGLGLVARTRSRKAVAAVA
jgi:hypothetical protein